MGSVRFLLFFLASLLITVSSETFLRQDIPVTTLTSGGLEGKDSGSKDLYCNSWRFSVETNNAGRWKNVPKECHDYLRHYIKDGGQYDADCMMTANNALSFAKSVEMSRDGNDVWIFDVGQTLLDNFDAYEQCGRFDNFNQTCYDEWVNSEKAKALPASKHLYDELRNLGFQLVLISGRKETHRTATERNLRRVGFSSYKALVMRDESNAGTTAMVYKSKQRAAFLAKGYKIHGNIGDQWSDLLGPAMAHRSFKYPNPMFYKS